MKKKLIFIFMTAVLFLSLVAAPESLFLEPYTYSADFESGSVGPWSSYPPYQDTALDTTIMVKKIKHGDSNALMREFVPNYAADTRFGLRKKLDLYVDAGSTLSFEFYIKSYSGTDGLLVKFGFYDGTSYKTKIPSKEILKWKKAEIDFNTFVRKDEIKHLQAIALMAICPDADPESLLRFAVDDVTVKGYRAMPFKIDEPDSYRLEEFHCFLLKKHFKEGKPIRIAGQFPTTAKIKKAAAVLSRALTGKDRKTFRMNKSGNNRWELMIPASESKKGIWNAEIEGTGQNGKKILSRLVFITAPEMDPSEHPRLLISKDDKKWLREAIKTGRHKKIWESIEKSALDLRENYNPENFNYHLDALDDIYWLPTRRSYFAMIRDPARLARANGLVYFLTGHREAGEVTKKTLLKMADWPTFLHPYFPRVGQYTYFLLGMTVDDLAVAYDTVYDLLTPDERKKIADALFRNGIKGIFKEYVEDNRVSSNTSNWIAHSVDGGIISAAVVLGQYTDTQLEPYLTGMILKLGELVKCGFDPTGNYGEGYSYHSYTLQTMAETIAVLERNFGIQFPESVFHSFKYIFYQSDPETGSIYDFGDARNQLGDMSNFVYILKKTRDPVLKWLYDRFPGSKDMDLFFYDQTIPSKAPYDLPKIVHFKDVGTVVFRSGFKPGDFAFIFRCGPFYNHQHFDHGTFFLLDKGEALLVSGPGRTDYFDDPWYHRLFIQPGGHNCILVDETIESQLAGGDLLHDVGAWQDHGKITDLLEFPGGAFLSGDLTGLYKGKFKSLTRNILYLAPRTIVIIDKGTGAHDAHRLNVRFNPEKKEEINLEGKTVEIKKNKTTLWIKTILPEPDGYTVEIKKRPLSLSEYPDPQKTQNLFDLAERGFLQLTTPVEPKCTMFVYVMSTDRDVIDGLNAHNSDKYTALTVEGTTFYINRSAGEIMNIGDIETDALVYAGLKNKHLVCRGKKMIKGKKRLVSVSEPISIIAKNK